MIHFIKNIQKMESHELKCTYGNTHNKKSPKNLLLVKFDQWITFLHWLLHLILPIMTNFIKNYIRGCHTFLILAMWLKYFRWSVMTMWDLILTIIPFTIIYVIELAGCWQVNHLACTDFVIPIKGSRFEEQWMMQKACWVVLSWKNPFVLQFHEWYCTKIMLRSFQISFKSYITLKIVFLFPLGIWFFVILVRSSAR